VARRLRPLLGLLVIGSAVLFYTWRSPVGPLVPDDCARKLPNYFVSTIRECAQATGDIHVDTLLVDERRDDFIRGRALVRAGAERLELDFSCARKSVVGWFPASASFRGRR
jgi:hypothetical protein